MWIHPDTTQIRVSITLRCLAIPLAKAIEADLEAFSPGPVAAHDVRGRAVIYIVTLNVHVPMTHATRRMYLCV